MAIVADVATVILALVAIIAFIFTCRHGVDRKRRMETIRCPGEIRAERPETLGLSDREKKGRLSKMVYFCTGVNEKIYDVRIVGRDEWPPDRPVWQVRQGVRRKEVRGLWQREPVLRVRGDDREAREAERVAETDDGSYDVKVCDL